MWHKYIKVEPYWNVNKLHLIILSAFSLIKVEPYWNVNIHIIHTPFKIRFIKVEPYWNVNYTPHQSDKKRLLLK